MGNKTNIEWTDSTWNPIRGCSRVSDGCMNCYAEKVANRFKGEGQAYEGLIAKGGQWNNKITVIDHLIDQPLRWTKPRRIFVNSMSDLFHENVTDYVIDKIFSVMAIAPRHTFQVLTKRPERMLEYLSTDRRREWAGAGVNIWGEKNPDLVFDNIQSGERILPNVWLGVSVENQKAADERIPLLLRTPAAIRWISAEPLIGPVDLFHVEPKTQTVPASIDSLRGIVHFPESGDSIKQINNGLDWVVVGGESGTGSRPMAYDWVRQIQDQCDYASAPFLFKQWGDYRSVSSSDVSPLSTEIKDKLFYFDHIRNEAFQKLGKKKAGRELDGVIWDLYPNQPNQYRKHK